MAGMGTFGVAVVLYAATTVLYYLEVARGKQKVVRFATLACWLLGGGAVAHALYVVVASFVAKVCPVHSMHFIFSICSLMTTSIYLAARTRYRIHALGLIVAPVGLVVTLGTFFLGATSGYHKLPAPYMWLHVLTNLVGFALFLLAGGAAGMYLVKEGRLKRKRALPAKGGLPALESLDRATHRFLIAGFPLLTVGVATGTVWSQQLEGGSTAQVLRLVFGYATWLLIAGVLLLRVGAGWRGRRAAYGTVAGFVCSLVVLVIYLVRDPQAVVGG